MATFVTHPSVRIKGTENNYSPVTCTDMSCLQRHNIHWHCPFCSCNESFNDVVILKAHYRVKHVDKGIEFAGLKVLRCCDTCDIVGAIKGEKKFKGAHWHCYRCRNGFNRRDEAIKHYRTHFRNPQTTFQIQIAQEVNHPNVYQEIETRIAPGNMECDETLSENIEMDMQVSVAANETVNSTPQAIMLIQGGNLMQSTANTNAEFAVSSSEYQIGDIGDVQVKERGFDKKYNELLAKYHEAVEDKARLTMTVEELKLEMQVHMQEVARYQKREEELLNQLSIPLDKGIQDLLKQLENEHRELLYHQLAHIKRTYPNLGAVSPGSPMTLDTTKQRIDEKDEFHEQVIPSNISDQKKNASGLSGVSVASSDERDNLNETNHDDAVAGRCGQINDAGNINSADSTSNIRDVDNKLDNEKCGQSEAETIAVSVASCNGEKHGADDECEDPCSEAKSTLRRASKRRKVT